MAEVAAGAGVALAAEEVVSTTAQAGVAGYMIAKPTLPLKATYTMIANATDDSTRRSLARSNHTLTVVGNKAYVFGGNTNHGGIATNDIHAITLVHSGEPEVDYHLIPALPAVEGGVLPDPRTKHAACAFRGCVVIYGGCDEHDQLVDSDPVLWLFDPDRLVWTQLQGKETTPNPGTRRNCKLFAHGSQLILCGGSGDFGTTASDIWLFDFDSRVWIALPNVPAPTSNAALCNSRLYMVSGSDPLSCELHHATLHSTTQSITWETITFPTNPLTPGPRARHSGGFLPITTGYGRNYLIYFLGARNVSPPSVILPEDDAHNVSQWSDMWTLQVISSDLAAKPKLKINKAVKPAKIKDSIRSAIGADPGTHSWAEVEMKLPGDLNISDGKLHPGPRAFFGCDTMEDGSSFVLWGGENAKGEQVGDGWIVRFE
ncbi:galactose oxidase [Corynespora cassiicola Philippines]|uniref:Galactose oxidase n=1 Tax=Corynespora cassiicola Philippines TaxID=1448308 RepID=A0A2T2N6L2_CORCC|nr:galactose oxidase [Corynespora cassiicola Philippines]